MEQLQVVVSDWHRSGIVFLSTGDKAHVWGAGQANFLSKNLRADGNVKKNSSYDPGVIAT
jgi:hypothetical protein